MGEDEGPDLAALPLWRGICRHTPDRAMPEVGAVLCFVGGGARPWRPCLGLSLWRWGVQLGWMYDPAPLPDDGGA